MVTRLSCPLCAVGSLGPAAPRWRGVEVRRCAACGTLLNAEIVRRSSEDVTGFGQSFFTTLGAQPAMWQVEVDAVREALAAIGAAQPTARPRLLDLGCGDGHFLVRARASGLEVAGVEPNDETRSLVTARGIPCFASLDDLLAADGEATFDAVYSSHTLEHVLEPARTLRGLWRAARPGGVLVATVPCAEAPAVQLDRVMLALEARGGGTGWRLFIPEHMTYFTGRTLEAAVRRAGFVDVRLTTGVFGERVVAGLVRDQERASRWWRDLAWPALRALGRLGLRPNLRVCARRPDGASRRSAATGSQRGPVCPRTGGGSAS